MEIDSVAWHDRVVDVSREWMFGRIMPRSFLENLGEHLSECCPGREAALVEEITRRVPAIMESNEDAFVDEAGRDLLGLCSVVLAAYEVLVPELGDEPRTLALFAHVASEFGRRSTRLGTRVLMAGPGDRIDAIERSFGATAPVLGDAWEVSYLRDGDRALEMRVAACGFHDFFARNGVPRLTTVMCAWDRTWMDELTPDRHGVEATRPTTLGSGGPACRFRFRAVD